MHLIIIDMIPKSKSQSSKAFGFKFDLSHSNIECFLRNPSRPRQQEPSRRPVHTAEHPHREKQEEKKEERREERREQRKGEQEQEPRDLKQSTSPDIVSDLSNSVLKKIEAEGVRHAWQEDEARNAQKEKADSSPEEVSGIWRLPWTFSAQSLSLGSSKKSLQGSEETCLSNPSTARHPQYAYSSGRGMSANMGVVTGAEMGMGAGMGLGAGLGVYGMPSMGHYHCGAERVDNFSVVEDRIEEDGRTTLMVRNIPNKYSLKLVSDEIDASHGDCYDFLYLPFDYNSRCNVGYAFINLVDAQKLKSFFAKYHGRKWSRFNSDKICEIRYARLQGRLALIDHFHDSKVLNEREKKFRPIIKDPQALLRILDGQKKTTLRNSRDA